jgi:hypothetical protein
LKPVLPEAQQQIIDLLESEARGVLSLEQRNFLDDIKVLGGMAVAAKSWMDIDQALREGGYVSDGPLFEEGDN